MRPRVSYAFAARTNALIEFWIAGFKLLGREVPYNTSEDIERALQASGAQYEKRPVAYHLSFPDTEENRMRIIRFLLADHLAHMPLAPLLGGWLLEHQGGTAAITVLVAASALLAVLLTASRSIRSVPRPSEWAEGLDPAVAPAPALVG